MWRNSIIIASTLFFASLLLFSYHLDCCDKCTFFNCVDTVATFIMSLCALFALYFTYSEYQNHVKLEQYKTLSEYNKRYSEDPNISEFFNDLY